MSLDVVTVADDTAMILGMFIALPIIAGILFVMHRMKMFGRKEDDQLQQ